MSKMNTVSNQWAFEYALYMMAGSYFQSARCKTPLLEKRMLLHYKEQKPELQYKMEDTCIAYMEKLVKQLPANVFEQDMVVRLKRGENIPARIIFAGKGFELVFRGVYAGPKSEITCEVSLNEDPQAEGESNI